MWNRSKSHTENEKLDRLGDSLLRAVAASETEINTAATSPFLYRRILVQIEQRRRAAESSPWLAVLLQMRRAVPVVLTLAMIALAVSWYAPERGVPANQLLAADQQQVTIGGIPALTQEELVTSLVGWENAKAPQVKER